GEADDVHHGEVRDVEPQNPSTRIAARSAWIEEGPWRGRDGSPEGKHAQLEAEHEHRVRRRVAPGRQPHQGPLQKEAKAAAGEEVYEATRTRRRGEPIQKPAAEVNHSQV